MKGKGYQIGLNTKYDGSQTGAGSMVYKFLNKKRGCAVTSKVAGDLTEVLSQELYETETENFKGSKGHPRFQDNIWRIKTIVSSASGCITRLLLIIFTFLYFRSRYKRLVHQKLKLKFYHLSK